MNTQLTTLRNSHHKWVLALASLTISSAVAWPAFADATSASAPDSASISNSADVVGRRAGAGNNAINNPNNSDFNLHTAPVDRFGNELPANTGIISNGANAPGTSNNAITSPGNNFGGSNGQPIRIEQAAPTVVSPTGR
jgi:hypothetical protein